MLFCSQFYNVDLIMLFLFCANVIKKESHMNHVFFVFENLAAIMQIQCEMIIIKCVNYYHSLFSNCGQCIVLDCWFIL